MCEAKASGISKCVRWIYEICMTGAFFDLLYWQSGASEAIESLQDIAVKAWITLNVVHSARIRGQGQDGSGKNQSRGAVARKRRQAGKSRCGTKSIWISNTSSFLFLSLPLFVTHPNRFRIPNNSTMIPNMGQRIKTRRMPRAKQIVPRILLFCAKKESVRWAPIVKVMPDTNKICYKKAISTPHCSCRWICYLHCQWPTGQRRRRETRREAWKTPQTRSNPHQFLT